MVDEKNKNIEELKKDLSEHNQEQHMTKRILVICILEDKKYNYQGKEIEFKKSQHDAQTKNKQQHRKYELKHHGIQQYGTRAIDTTSAAPRFCVITYSQAWENKKQPQTLWPEPFGLNQFT